MKSNDIFTVKEYKGLKYMQFNKLLELGVNHAYTLKSDGFDFSFNVSEEERSYDILAEALEIDKNNILKPVQTHTDKVLCVSDTNNNLNDIDGLITNKSDLALTAKNADCILFLFYDPVKKVIANVHSGWKGTFQKIAEKTVVKMISNYGCLPEDIICCICPSIRKCHFEVESDVKEMCEDIFAFTGKTNEFISLGKIKNGEQKYNIDTVLINKIIFNELGMKDENIIDCNICSVCECDELHSARVEKDGFKRCTAIITL